MDPMAMMDRLKTAVKIPWFSLWGLLMVFLWLLAGMMLHEMTFEKVRTGGMFVMFPVIYMVPGLALTFAYLQAATKRVVEGEFSETLNRVFFWGMILAATIGWYAGETLNAWLNGHG